MTRANSNRHIRESAEEIGKESTQEAKSIAALDRLKKTGSCSLRQNTYGEDSDFGTA